jgi:hypothetical protein
MGFKVDSFDRAEFTARRASVPVDALAAFFDQGEPAVWQVRGLSSAELHRALEAGKRQGSIEQIVRAIAGGGDQAEAVRAALGLSKDTPGEIAKRLEMLVMGSVAPKVELPTAVKLAEAFPIEFLSITNKITELTGQGFDLVKPAAASQPNPA